VGYLEKIISERKPIQHCGIRLDILYFIGCNLDDESSWHSTLGRTHQLLPEAIFEDVFTKVLEMRLLKGLFSVHTQTISSTTIKANASMDSLELKVTEETLGAHLHKIRHFSSMDKEVLLRQSKSNKASQSQQIVIANSQELAAIKSRNKK
jgi:hypothetical protein